MMQLINAASSEQKKAIALVARFSTRRSANAFELDKLDCFHYARSAPPKRWSPNHTAIQQRRRLEEHYHHMMKTTLICEQEQIHKSGTLNCEFTKEYVYLGVLRH